MAAAIIYLSQARRMSLLMRSLRLLQQNYLDKFPHDVIMFHEGDFLEPQQIMLKDLCPSLTFREVNIDPPPHIDVSQHRQWSMIGRFGVGYRNMCRFFAMGLYPLIQDLDYYMRLDDDSFIQSPVTEDPFETMSKNSLQYGFRCTRPERSSSINGLVECMRQNGVPGVKWNKKIFYNNFHIAKPTLWLREPIKSVLEAIDKHGGIYMQRWGDAPIQTLLVRAFIPNGLRHCFTGFKYSHGRHTWPIGG